MIRRAFALMALGGLLAALPAPPADARVVRIEVERTAPYAGGKEFGDAGAFERLDGTVHMEVDPDDPLNALIVNLDRAPRNDRGMVEFSAPFFIIKPVDMARGNQKLLYGINNRGNAIELGFQTFPSLPFGADPESGDGLFFRLGYTLVDAGWAGDIVTTPTRLGANLPVAVQADGSPIVSRIRIEYSTDLAQAPAGADGLYSVPLKGNDRFVSYATADTETAHSTLTVRDAIDGTRRPIAADRWAFGTCPSGEASLEASATDICLFDGFDRDKTYELIYPAKDPWVMGLGYAVTRDVASFLRYQTADDAGTPNPLAASADATGIRRAYGLGISSTGMYLRDWLYLGFNEDEAHRRVFDAVRIHIPGSHRLFANVEFSDPNIYSRQDRTTDFTSTSAPPLTYAVTTDPVTNVRDGILKRPATDPLVFHVDTSNEFWQMKASLNVHDGHGNPVPIPDNVRLYLLASHPHGGATGVGVVPTDRGACQHVANTNRSAAPAMRALLVALDEWADRGVEPPASNYPDVRRGTLATVDEAARTFPAIPGVSFPTTVNGL
ncbi:MAG: alpha/beta hydrolase domain-containing protein, partial [Acidobacteria bacterium]|nr:alpha/beta hydrolase domain-containing protein [Acidobacteriota bacterium]